MKYKYDTKYYDNISLQSLSCIARFGEPQFIDKNEETASAALEKTFMPCRNNFVSYKIYILDLFLI